MSRLVATLTILCFMIVSVLGGGYGILCVRSCKAAVAPAADEPEESACGGCCGSNSPAAESSCPFSRTSPEPESAPDCGSRPICGGSSDSEAPICPRAFCPVTMPCETDCDKCTLPRLDFVLAENKTQTPKIESGQVPRIEPDINDNILSYSIVNTHHPGIHPIIATTVMRL